MRYSEKHVDMRTGSLYKNILLFTVQIALSSMLQQLFNAADTAILGIFDTSSALALSGIGNVILNIMIPCAHRCEKFPPYCTKLLIYYLLVIKSCASP